MALNPREKKIAVGTSVVLALIVLYEAIISPLMDRRETLETTKHDLQAKLDDANSLFGREQRLKKVWSDMEAGGLSLDASHAETQALQSIIAWAAKAGVQLSALKPERSSDERKFKVISFNVTGTGAMPDMARLLWAMETAPIPLRVNDMEIKPRKEGTDDLSARISVSALCLPLQSSSAGVSSYAGTSSSAAGGSAGATQ